MAGNKAETAIGGTGGAFPSTLWSVVIRAKDPNSPGRREALQMLIQAYWKPLYFFLRRKGNSVESSKDLTQGFFAELLEKDFLQYVNRGRGRFRSFLLTALEHHLLDEVDRSKAQKRGGGRPLVALDFEGAENEVAGRLGESPDAAFRRDWAIHVMSQALARLQATYEVKGRGAEFQVLKGHLTSTRPEGSSYESLAQQLGRSVEDIRNRIRSARAGLREAILEVVREYTDSEAEASEELADLKTAFS